MLRTTLAVALAAAALPLRATSLALGPSQPHARGLVRRDALRASALVLLPAVQLPARAAADAVVVEGQITLGELGKVLEDRPVKVEIIARRIGKGIVATKTIEAKASAFPSPFTITTAELNEGVNVENTLGDDVYILATLDVMAKDGSAKRVAQSQGKAPIKKGERLKPLITLE